MSGPERPHVLYIAGIGRNGGTLLDRILGATDGLASLGEVHFLWQKGLRDNELCGCGEAFGDCEFWSNALAAAFPDGLPDAEQMVQLAGRVDRSRHIPALLGLRGRRFSQDLATYAHAWQRVFGALHRRTGGRILVDSSKFASRALILADMPDIELSVLHLVRDPRGAAFSWQKRRDRPEVTRGTAHMRRYSAFSTACQWLYRNLSVHLLRRRATRYRRLRYEDFAENPAATVATLLDWLGAEASAPFVSDTRVHLRAMHTQSGNPMRFEHGEIEIRPDNAWRTRLRRPSRWLVTALTWPVLIAYRYRLSP